MHNNIILIKCKLVTLRGPNSELLNITEDIIAPRPVATFPFSKIGNCHEVATYLLSVMTLKKWAKYV